jgi:rod shape-determining protein MreD
VRCGLVLLVLGLLLTMAQGAAGIFLPPQWSPDLGLLLVVAMALSWRSSAGGLLLAVLSGYLGDLLSGTLFGQHALLHLLAYGAARASSAQLNLRGALPQAGFVAFLTAAHAVALACSTAFFVPGVEFALPAAGALTVHAAINGVVAPLVTAVVARVVSLLSPDEAGRRLLQLEPRSFGT